MDEDQNALAEQVSGDDEDVVDGGIGPGDAEEAGASAEDQGTAEEAGASAEDQGTADQDEPYSIKKRLGMQAKKHQREMRQMQDHMMRMQAQLGGDSANPQQTFTSNPFPSPGQPNPPSMTEEDRINHAVRIALGAKDHQEQQLKMAERQAHVNKQYQRLNDEFDKASDKYDDFDDIVRESDAPFSDHVRDALLLVKNPAEVAYRLGKNRSELERISRLHPIDQAQEVIDLSHSLRTGAGQKPAAAHNKSNPLGAVRANPTGSSRTVTDKTPASEIRARMKAGTWK